ncbi:MAG: hypothetical protein NTW87_36575 [Planctomycetota bacterium]|nr:hypothetical protein [Planctomycetota bacterium]
MSHSVLCWAVLGAFLLLTAGAAFAASEREAYHFDGRSSREVLERYLARAITQLGLSHSAQRAEDIRMLKNAGAKFIGRAAYLWGHPGDDEAYFRQCQETAGLVHQADPDMLLQACVFEAIYDGVNKLPVPAWVFEEFGLKPEQRNFSYDAMLFDKDKFKNHWCPGASVPDMSKLETRMWFFYRARRYIDAGYEGIHFGQVHLMNQNDPGHRHWFDVLGRIRAYAATHARRHLVLCDAHTHGVVEIGKLLFDFHAFPLRIKDVPDKPQQCILEMNHIDSIFGRSKGRQTPSGWTCEHLPYIVELDNWGSSGKGGKAHMPAWGWAYDEICWFARQPPESRNEWLRYAWKWVREHDPNGWLQMPGQRCLADPINGVHTYYANTKSKDAPQGFDQEETIKAIWAE